MSTKHMTYFPITRLVDELFSTHRYGQNCQNPVTGGGYVHGVDPIKPQKEKARRGLLAREWFAIYGPADAQPLPFWCDEVRLGLLAYIVRLYARSLEDRDYDINKHPPFADYVSGVLWEAERIDGIIGKIPTSSYPAELAELKKRFPPKELVGMGPGFSWLPPKVFAEIMLRYRRSMARHAELDKRVKTQPNPLLPPLMKARKFRNRCAVRQLAPTRFTKHQKGKRNPRIRSC